MPSLQPPAAKAFRLPLIAFVVAAPLAWFAWTAYAASRSWSGSGANNNWSTAANWTGTVVPANNDDLVFPSGGAQKSNNNDLVSRTFNTLTIQGGGYTLSGNPLILTAGITDAAVVGPTDNIVNIPLTLGASQTFTSNATGRVLRIGGGVATGGHALALGGTGSLSVTGGITGSGGLTKTGAGIANLGGSAANSYTGQTTVGEGQLTLSKSVTNQSVSGSVVVGDGAGEANSAILSLSSVNQIPDTASVTVNSDGQFVGLVESVGQLTVNGGNVSTGTGTLTATGLTMAGGNVSSTGAGKLLLNGNVTATAPASTMAPIATIDGSLDLGGQTRTFTANGAGSFDLSVSANVSNGGLTKAGAGLLSLRGANNYTGPTTILSGVLEISGEQPQSSVTVNGGTLAGIGTVGPVNAVNGFVKPSLGGVVSNTLNVQGNVTFSPQTTFAPVIVRTVHPTSFSPGVMDVTGTVSLGGSNLNFELDALSNTGFAPGFTLTIINNDGDDAIANTFNGLPEGSSFTAHGATFFITYRGGDGNDVTLHVPTTRTWDGQKDDGTASADANWTTKENWAGDVAPQVGDSLVFPETAQSKTNTNNITANTTFNSLTLSGGGYTIGGNALKVVSGVTDSHASGANTVSLATGGTGGLTKNGAATLSLSGNNTYSGTTTVSAGTLQISGGQLQSPVTVSGGALAGNGTVGPITTTSGSVRPGSDSGPNPALNAQGNVSFSPAATYSPLIRRVEALGIVGTFVSKLDVVGTVTLGGAALAPDFSGIPVFSSGPTCCAFVLIANDGTDGVAGTFNGLPEGSLLSYHGQYLRLSYRGGTDNNDVTLTVAGPPTFSVDDVSVTEGNSGQINATFTVRLSEAITNASATVNYQTANSSATAFNDYVATSGTLTFGPRETQKTVTVAVNGDAAHEPDELFVLLLSSPTNATILDSTGTCTILNDDPPPTISINDVSVAEGNTGGKNAFLVVTLSAASYLTVTVNYATADGTATAGSDYVAASGTLTFAPDQTRKEIPVLITPDVVSEPDETFFVNLSSPSNAAIADGQGVGTIADDDGACSYQLSQTARNSPAAGESVTVNVTAAAGCAWTAASNSEFISVTAGASGSGGGSVTFNVAANPSPAQRTGTLTVAGQTVTVTQAAGGTVFHFEAAASSVSEGAARAEVRIARAGDVTGAASVGFQTVDDPAAVPCATAGGTAYARCDYATTIETVRWGAGDALPKTVTVPVIDDGRAEGSETLQVRLSNPQGGTVGAQGAMTITITDNETADGVNPVNGNQFFVRQHYLDFLSREPEQGEPWTGVLDRCPDVNNQDPNSPSAGCDRLLVSQSFFQSPEFQLKGLYTFLFYRVAFDRRPAYDEIIPDMRSLAGSTGAEVFARRTAYATETTLRPEFTQLYGPMTNQQFVGALLGRYQLQQITTEDPQNPEGEAQVTLTGQQLADALNSNSLTRAQVLRAVVQSSEVDAAEYHSAFVAMQYYGYLRRTPEEGGYQAWLRVIRQDPNNIRIMVNGFVNSPEYRLRFGQP